MCLYFKPLQNEHNAAKGLFTALSVMKKKDSTKNSHGVDKSLVAMFLRMSVEERLETNNNAARAILELRNAFKQQQRDNPGSERNT